MEILIALTISFLCLVWFSLVAFDKRPYNTKNSQILQFTELDEEIAEKERELKATMEIKEKERYLKKLEEQIKRVSEMGEKFGITTEEATQEKVNTILTAEQVREKQKNTHWSDDVELLKVYQESKIEILKIIEQEIKELMLSDIRVLSYTWKTPFQKLIIHKNTPIYKFKKSIASDLAKKDLEKEIVKELKLLGYIAKFETPDFSSVIYCDGSFYDDRMIILKIEW